MLRYHDELKQFSICRYQFIWKCVRVLVTDLLLLSERHKCQWLHGLILQNSSKLLILHVLWDLKKQQQKNNNNGHLTKLWPQKQLNYKQVVVFEDGKVNGSLKAIYTLVFRKHFYHQ